MEAGHGRVPFQINSFTSFYKWGGGARGIIEFIYFMIHFYYGKFACNPFIKKKKGFALH